LTDVRDARTRAADRFRDAFRRDPDVIAAAPGRVNLIGEHTDYNGGFVLPTAIPQQTWVAAARARGGIARATTTDLGDLTSPIASFVVGDERRLGAWIDYVQGCTKAMTQAGIPPAGFDLAIASDVPLGSGLSSSAALEVSVMRALRDLFALPLDDVMVAKLGQRAENDFVGAPVGIMDQMAASLADAHTALFLDTRTLEYEQVSLPDGGALVVINSGVAHNHASGDYRTRRGECERAAEMLGIAQLRDAGLADLDRIAGLPVPLDRRAKHVVTENQRVLDAVEAMKAHDLPRLGALFYASHLSQRDDFQDSVPEIDLLVDLAREESEVFGARLTGGGFGGSVVLLVKDGAQSDVARRLVDRYHARFTARATVLVPQGSLT
jgi:galactokinase